MFTPALFPQQLHWQHILAFMMKFESPTSLKPEMRNYVIKDRWKYLNLTFITQWLGAVCQSRRLISAKLWLSSITRNPLSASGPCCQCFLFMWCHPILHEICVIISSFTQCGFKISPLCFYMVNGLDSLKESRTPWILHVFLVLLHSKEDIRSGHFSSCKEK